MFSTVRSRTFQSCRFWVFTSPIFSTKHFPMKPFLRTATLLPIQLRKSVLLDKSHHRLVYNFPYMPYLAGFMKSKISVPIAACALSPILYFLDETHASPIIIICSAGIYFAMGTVLAKFAANLVGKMYVNKENEITEIIMSSVDETGRRIDRIHKLQDLVNVDYPNKLSRSLGFIAIGVEDSDFYYKINIRTCKFIDESACDYVFGFTWSGNVNETSESRTKETQKLDTDKRLPEK